MGYKDIQKSIDKKDTDKREHGQNKQTDNLQPNSSKSQELRKLDKGVKIAFLMAS